MRPVRGPARVRGCLTPERHFHRFGGLYPNPSVLGAALATTTERLQIRAGSVVVPLHHPVRIAEEWAVVDNLSGGRVGLAFAAGFHPNDFVFAPERFADRKQAMFEGIERVRELWRGGSVFMRGGAGEEVRVELFPKPVQPELPFWLVTGGNPETFVEAGQIGANLLTALLFLDRSELAQRIGLYRESRARHGFDPGQGRVTLMLHTFLGSDLRRVKAAVEAPLLRYLRSHLELIRPMARSHGVAMDEGALSARDEDALLAFALERYLDGGALIGTEHSCRTMVEQLAAIGVDEIACLVDFGLETGEILSSLEHVHRLMGQTRPGEGPWEPAGDAASAARV